MCRSGEINEDTTSFKTSLGVFHMNSVHVSWVDALMLGALDYFKSQIKAYQLIPDGDRKTIDVPNLSRKVDFNKEPIWKWLDTAWEFDVPEKSFAVTNIEALRGKLITEAARWEDDQWELFSGAGPDVTEEDMRVIPLGTLLAYDSSLIRVTELKVGEALWRNQGDKNWNQWVASET